MKVVGVACIAVSCAFLAPAPSALAGGVFDSPVARVEIVDCFGSACAIPVVGASVADFSTDGSPGSSRTRRCRGYIAASTTTRYCSK